MATEQIKNKRLISLLQENREKLNSTYNFYKFTYPLIEKEVLFHYISSVIEPIFDKNKKIENTILSTFFISLFEKLLELIGKNFIGNSGRFPFFENKFVECLSESHEWMFESPDLYLSSISNALLNLGLVDLKKLDAWLSIMKIINSKSKDKNTILSAGKVAAWKCGMAQYRKESLSILKELDDDLLQSILEITNIKSINRENFISRLENDPWLSPEQAIKENSRKKNLYINRVGGFSGFGGEFNKPPQVELLEDEFIISDASNFYVLFADIFGTFLQRISDDTYLALSEGKKEKSNPHFSVNKAGMIQFGIETTLYLPAIDYSMQASNSNTLCITSQYSHCVFVAGLI